MTARTRAASGWRTDLLVAIPAPALIVIVAGGLVLVTLGIAALAIAITGHDPVQALLGIGKGMGIGAFLPGVEGRERTSAVRNLQQVLIFATPLLLTAVATALPLRAGLFNIGAQGQYLFGAYAAIAVGTADLGSLGPFHAVLATLAACAAGAAFAGAAVMLRTLSGANEVIVTIMFNWIAIFLGKWALATGGPLHGDDPDLPRSFEVLESARLPAIWGNLQAVHAGIFVALAVVLLFGWLMSRTSLGFRLRAVGANPFAARVAGMPIRRTLLVAFALGGACAGLAGAMDLLGWRGQLTASELEIISGVGIVGIAVALLGAGRPLGIVLATLLFAGLQVGTSSRNIDPTVLPSELAGNLATMLQGVIVLAVAGSAFLLPRLQAQRAAALATREAVARAAQTPEEAIA